MGGTHVVRARIMSQYRPSAANVRRSGRGGAGLRARALLWGRRANSPRPRLARVAAMQEAGIEPLTLLAKLVGSGQLPVEPVADLAPSSTASISRPSAAPRPLRHGRARIAQRAHRPPLAFEAVRDRLPEGMAEVDWAAIRPNLATRGGRRLVAILHSSREGERQRRPCLPRAAADAAAAMDGPIPMA